MSGEASARNLQRLGLLEETMWARPDAERICQRMLQSAQEDSPQIRVEALNSLGVIARNSGTLEQALKFHREALDAAEAASGITKAIMQFVSLNNLGIVHRMLGNWVEAKACYERALATIQTTMGTDNRLGLQARSNLAKLYLQMGDPAAADRVYRNERRELIDPVEQLIDIDTRICILDALEEDDELIPMLEELATRAATAGLRLREAVAYEHLGRIHYFKLSQIQPAIAFYDKAVCLLQRSDHRGERSRVLYYRALARCSGGDYSAAYTDAKLSVQELELAQAQLSGRAFQSQELAREINRYNLLALACAMLGQIGEALECVEKARSQVLSALLWEKQIRPSANVPKCLMDSFDRLREERRRLDLLLVQEQERPRSLIAATVAAELAARSVEWKTTLGQIAQLDPVFEQISDPLAIRYEEIVNLIPTDQRSALIEFQVTTDCTMAFVVCPQKPQFKEYFLLKGLGRDALFDLLTEKWLKPYNDFVAARAESVDRSSSARLKLGEARVRLFESMSQVLEELHDRIFTRDYGNERSLEDYLREQQLKRVLFVPHGMLHIVPLHALFHRNSSGSIKYLLDDYEVVYAPSCKVLKKSLEGLQRLSAADRLAAVADPDGTLPGARMEVDAIKKLFRSSTVLTGHKATTRAVGSGIVDADVIHFSCHGKFIAQSPLDSHLVLADGTVSLSSIFETFRLKPGCTVVLSACETSLVRPDRTDEYLGLPSGFLFAGASSVLGSLWAVDDAFTAQLMGTTYERVFKGGCALSAGLHQAQLALKANRRYQHPYYWAAFSVVGAGWLPYDGTL